MNVRDRVEIELSGTKIQYGGTSSRKGHGRYTRCWVSLRGTELRILNTHYACGHSGERKKRKLL